METEKIFKTKTGFCHVTADRIVLTRDGIIGDISTITAGNNIARILLIYALMALGLFYFAYDSYVKGDKGITLLFGFLGLYLVYGIIGSLNHSATSVINRKDIQRVVFKKGIRGITRPRFEMLFREKGKIKKRLILLPGSLSGSPADIEQALKIMREEHFIN